MQMPLTTVTFANGVQAIVQELFQYGTYDGWSEGTLLAEVSESQLCTAKHRLSSLWPDIPVLQVNGMGANQQEVLPQVTCMALLKVFPPAVDRDTISLLAILFFQGTLFPPGSPEIKRRLGEVDWYAKAELRDREI